MKDSRKIIAEDRARVLEIISVARERLVIVSHGTYTMAETGKYLKRNMGKTAKTIILTGSMIPVSGFAPSDAPFNLGYAVAAVQFLPRGVYLCMNGRFFDPDNVAKNIPLGKFEEK